MHRPHAFATTMTPWLAIGAVLALTAFVYWPGLAGGFVYDDASFIVGNDAVHVTTDDLRSWAAAAFSFPGGSHQGRWLGMLSFAANHYFGGLDPYGYKLANLAIHLLNGLFVFLALRALFALHRECAGSGAIHRRFDPALAAAAIAGLWLLLPINLTGVLYVSQRLESLSSTFVFLGLWWYLRARLAQWRGKGGIRSLWLSLALCTGVGVLVKESAVLLPLYAACSEWVLPRLRNANGKRSRAVTALHAAVFALPLLVGLAWLGSWLFGPAAYAHSYDTWHRLLTETRVLIQYVAWTLVPSLDTLTLYHDDIRVSRGLLDPASTLASVACLLALAGAAVFQRARRPLFALGILWFFCGHALTATVIPLLLAFEHRNYFPSLGLLLAGASLVVLEGPLAKPAMRVATAVAIGCFYAFTTWMRAHEWSDPMRLVASDASKRPDSPLAQYDWATRQIKAGIATGQPALERRGLQMLDAHRGLRGAGISYEQTLISVTTDLHGSVDPDWYASIIRKLLAAPPSFQDAKALQNLNACVAARTCAPDATFLDRAYAAAMGHPHPSAVLLYVHSQYAAFLANDNAQAERDLRQAIALSPIDPALRSALATILVRSGNRVAAERELRELRRVNHFGIMNPTIAEVEAMLAERGGAK